MIVEEPVNFDLFSLLHGLIPANTFLKQAFEGEYPKLLRLYNELWRRLQQNKLDLGVSGGTLVLQEEGVGIPDGQEQDIYEQKPDVPFEYVILLK